MQRRPRSTRLPFRVHILYILQLNFRCHRGWKERHNQTKQRVDAHRNASSSKIMPNIATLFKATTPEKVTGAEQSTTSLSLLLTILHPHAEISMPTTVRTFFFLFCFLQIMKSFTCRFPADTKWWINIEATLTNVNSTFESTLCAWRAVFFFVVVFFPPNILILMFTFLL